MRSLGLRLTAGAIAVLAAGCSPEFLEALAGPQAGGPGQPGAGAFAPGRYEVHAVSVKLDADDFLKNDEPSAPELFIIVRHRGRVLLDTSNHALVKPDSYGVAYDGVRFDLDWQREDEIAVEVWDKDIADHDLLLRWVSEDRNAPLLARQLRSQNGSEVVFTCSRKE